ncbi:AAA family ATPase [Micavibrio aeruginosavorus]|uniref:AAA family ATPase n=1 Tax=Micavibrio aeruginosavorus TaxID=349221 RepID=UPI00130E9D9E|nr:helicase RepA family protein [Micavibrio aeruginosavorus]
MTEDQGFADYLNQGTAQLPKKPITLYPWPDLQAMERRKYLIKGLLEQGGMSVVYGESNSGKTFFALDIAAHMSLGWSWQDRKTRKGKVIYIAAESGLGIAERLIAFRNHHKLERYGELYLALRTILLVGENNDCDQLIEKIKETEDVELVVVDTLARAMGGGNENSSEDMGFFIRCCDKIREETGAHVMVIHHSGKDSSRGARGHSSLRAAIDTEIEVSQDSGVITAQVLKQRDGKLGDQFSFELTPIEIGEDEDGEPITSCVLSPCLIAPKEKKLSGQKRRALDILRNCIIDKGEKRQVRKEMPMVDCVTLSEYRDYLKREKISSSDKPDSENKAITRAIDQLNNAGITCSYTDYIWIVDRKDKSGQTNPG